MIIIIIIQHTAAEQSQLDSSTRVNLQCDNIMMMTIYVTITHAVVRFVLFWKWTSKWTVEQYNCPLP